MTDLDRKPIAAARITWLTANTQAIPQTGPSMTLSGALRLAEREVGARRAVKATISRVCDTGVCDRDAISRTRDRDRFVCVDHIPTTTGTLFVAHPTVIEWSR
jgi:hypothetical protein